MTETLQFSASTLILYWGFLCSIPIECYSALLEVLALVAETELQTVHRYFPSPHPSNIYIGGCTQIWDSCFLVWCVFYDTDKRQYTSLCCQWYSHGGKELADFPCKLFGNHIIPTPTQSSASCCHWTSLSDTSYMPPRTLTRPLGCSISFPLMSSLKGVSYCLPPLSRCVYSS